MVIVGIIIGLVLGIWSAKGTRSMNVGQIGVGIGIGLIGGGIGLVVSLIAYAGHFSQDGGALLLCVVLSALVSAGSFGVARMLRF